MVEKNFCNFNGKYATRYADLMHDLNKKIHNLDSTIIFDMKFTFYEISTSFFGIDGDIISLCVKGDLVFIVKSNKSFITAKEKWIVPLNNLVVREGIVPYLESDGNHDLNLAPDIKYKESFVNIMRNLSAINFFKEMKESISSGFYPNGKSYNSLSDNQEFFEDKVYEVNELILEKLNQKSIGIEDENCCLLFNSDIAQLIQNKSLSILNEQLEELSFFDYGFVDITRTTTKDVHTGSYIYQIDKAKTLKLILNPLKTIININGDAFAIFDKDAYNKSTESIVTFREDDVKDFQLFGSEMVDNRISTFENDEVQGTINSPKLLGTAFSELLFGSSHATLKGMSSMMQQLNQTIKANKVNIKTISEIIDNRSVQLIFNDNTDIELKGISIYYDFNRKMGNVKNKKNKLKESLKEISETSVEDEIQEKLKKYKEMLEKELIDVEEFKILKKKLLNL